MKIICRTLVLCALTAVSAVGAQRIEDAYIAPVNHFIFKMVFPDGLVREFQRDPARAGGLIGVNGWDGDVGDDGTIIIRNAEGGARERFEFFRGRLVSHTATDGTLTKFAYDQPRQAPKMPYTPLDIVEFADEQKEATNYSRQELAEKWADTGRLSFPYVNPNHAGALYAELTLLALIGVFFFWGRHRWLACALGALAAGFAACTVWTGSRGSLLGLLVGLVAMFSFRMRRLVSSRLFWISVGLVTTVLAVWLAFGGFSNLTRGFTATGGLDWSNAIRLDMWKTAPRMMVDAPGGWGDVRAGHAYFDWYQPIDALCLTGSLMNDHLTILTQTGWFGRFAYLFVLFFILIGGFWASWRCGRAITFSVWTAFTVMAWFNPLYEEWGLWLIPVGALAPLAVICVRRPKMVLGTGVAAIVVSALVLAAFLWSGTAASGVPDRPPTHIDGARVLINGRHPRIWVVDDGRGAFGGMLASRDIRAFYAADQHLPAIGYVRDIANLPSQGIDRLVLAGKAANDWMIRLSENEKARENLPKSVVFVSPPFLPSEVSEGVLALCRPRLIVGEFAARYQAEYANAPSWVVIVPGMEKYLLLWPQYVFGE